MSDELKAKVAEHLDRAYGTGKWAVAVFRVDPEEGVKINRVTNDFQTGDFLTAVALLAANLAAEQERLRNLPPPPLPRAYPFKYDGGGPRETVPVPQEGCATPPSDIIDSMVHGYGELPDKGMGS